MRDTLREYREFLVDIDGASVIFFINGSDYVDRQPRKSNTHSHYHTEIFGVLRGEMKIITESGTEQLTAGDVVLIPDNIIHQTECSEDILRLLISFHIPSGKNPSSRIIAKLNEISNAETPIRFSGKPFIDTLNRIIYYAHNSFDFQAYLIDGALRELVALMCQSEKNHKRVLEAKLSYGRNYRNYVINESFLKVFASNDLPLVFPTLEELSNYLHISKKQTERCVKELFGHSFKEHVVELRIKKAAIMLESTDMSVNKISEAVGYSGTRSFFSAFKNKYGITPMNYRRAKAASTSVDNGAGESSLRRS